MKIYYGKAVYDNKEINAAIKVLKRKSLTLIDGPSVKELEHKISKLFGKKYGLMVNSGSSANLLALSSFKFKLLKYPKNKSLLDGFIIVPSCILYNTSDAASFDTNVFKFNIVNILPTGTLNVIYT